MKKFIIFIVIIIILGLGVFIGYKMLDKDDNSLKKIFNKETYAEYKAGDRVIFGDTDWYVMYDSNKDSDYVTLINDGIMYLYDEDIVNVLDTIYEISDLRKYLENDYLKELGEDNFVEIHGYKVRLLNKDDMDSLIKYEYDEDNDEYKILECPDYICDLNWSYATMIDTNTNKEYVDAYNNVSDIEDLNDEYLLHLKYYNVNFDTKGFKLQSLVDDVTLFVRPVINVYKNSLEE